MTKLPKVGDYVHTPRFLDVRISAVFDSYEDMIKAGFTEPTHFRGDFKVNGKSIDMYTMRFACSPVSNGEKRRNERVPAPFGL